MQPVDEPKALPPRRFQFRISTLLILTAAMSVLCLALGGMFRHSANGDSLKVRFILLTLLSPLGLVLLVALSRWLLVRGRESGPRRPKW